MELPMLDIFELILLVALGVAGALSWVWWRDCISQMRLDWRTDLAEIKEALLADLDSRDFVTRADCLSAHADINQVAGQVVDLERRVGKLESER